MIPRAADLAGSTLRHRPSDLFNPPALTNFLGCVQADVDPVGIRNLNFPPFATSNIASGVLFLDGKIFAASGSEISFAWRPDRIDRAADADGIRIRSATALVWRERAVIVQFEIENASGTRRRLPARVGVAGSVARDNGPWGGPLPPMDLSNEVAVDASRQAVVFISKTGAASLQGIAGGKCRVDPRGISFELELDPGEAWRGAYISVIAATEKAAQEVFDRIASDPSAEITRAESEWDQELEAIFTPGNDRYSGSLPLLETSNEDLRRLYLMGILGVVYFKRETEASIIGRTYDTLMPRYWQTVTFLWDYSLSSLVHALLDPQIMRTHLEMWMTKDIHTLFATEWLTGSPVGEWYSVNDHAMCSMILRYLSWSGDMGWLEEKIENSSGERKTVLSLLEEYATAWRRFESPSGLADYGGLLNLLECVSTYVHEVAAMNAANVWNLRAAAKVFDSVGDSAKSGRFRDEADRLRAKVWELYAEGEGFWNARFPDGRLVDVRHCYDFLTITNLLPEDLSQSQREEMAAHFLGELRTPSWMHALSPKDPDAIFSVRPDHQFNGAYTAWPALTAKGLFKIGRADVAAEWMRGLARSANQGPFGQAHFVESFAAPEDGGALKASAEFPYINDWACSSGGAWAELVIGSVFGVEADLEKIVVRQNFRSPESGPAAVELFDRDARLVGLPHRGRLYDVDSSGLRETK